MNAIKRFVNLLTSPLMPMRLFVVEDDFDFSWTDTVGGYYDSEGNYLGDDSAAASAAAESHDDPSLDNDNWSEYSDDFGNVNIQTDGNGNITGTSYKDPETGEWKESDYGGDRNSAANNKKNEEVMQVFGASMTPETLAALNGGNKMDVGTALEGAAKGNPAAVAMVTAMTGTVPDPDSLKGLGYTDEQINTAITFAETLTQALAEGKDPNAAWKEASNKTGDPYGTNARDQYLKDSIINTILMFGPSLLGAGTKAALGGKVAGKFKSAQYLQSTARNMKAAQYIPKEVANKATKAASTAFSKGMALLEAGDRAGTYISISSLAGQLGIGYDAAKEIYDAYNNDKKRYGDSSDDEITREDISKEPESSKTTSTPESTSTRADTGSKSDPVITGSDPFGTNGKPDISIPEGPLAGTPLSGTGLPGGETNPTKEDAEDRGFENDNSGSDTMEETSQDAPTSGLGGDTFSNPNNDNERKGWGLGEEDPNRANYDTDKWNRGMERVSTDVVSDEKFKAFISKTFKDDPVLIKAVKIMRTIK